MHEAGSHEQVAIERCLLLPETMVDLPGTLAGTLNYAIGNEPTWPYRLGIRHSVRTGQSEIALWSSPTGMRRAFVAQLLEQAFKANSYVRVLTRAEDASRDVIRTEVLAGRGHWTEDLAGIRFRISAPSFFQVNTAVAELMVSTVLELAEPDGRHIWDLYSGAGSFSLPLAQAGAEVSAVEIAGSSIRDLRRNLEATGLDDSIEVYPGDVARVIGELDAADLAIVDPPASGLDAAVITGIAEANIPELIYVSCDPQTLARDAARLQQLGYQLQSARPFDLFPQSYHVETIAVFRALTV
jgi:23S rRNA (uracil1939-C5)-methyltransferase